MGDWRTPRDDEPPGHPDTGKMDAHGDDGFDPEDEFPEPVELPITDELDLHTFHPSEVKTLVPDYLQECRRRGIYDVRIVHGKGTGALQATVHATLLRLPYVVNFSLGDHLSGSWGATLVQLDDGSGRR